MELHKQLQLRQRYSVLPGIINGYKSMQLPCIVLSRRGYRYQAVAAMYALFTRIPISFPLLTTGFSGDKIHSANLQLEVCILGIHNISHNHRVPKMGRLCLLFPVPAQQAQTKECLTLCELEFENMEHIESVSDNKIELNSGPSLQ